MNPATLQLVISAVLNALDLLDRLVNKTSNDQAELEAYVAQRDTVRKQLVDAAEQLVPATSERDSKVASTDVPPALAVTPPSRAIPAPSKPETSDASSTASPSK